MCGLYGKAALGRDLNVDDCLRRIAMLGHRGPDFCGSYISENVFLGHSRLSILDLTPAGNQPFGNSDAKLVFNGEIYNWQELHERFLPERELITRSDTEVLFELFRKMGPACLPFLNGMFAFAFHDAKAGKLYLARDITGIKPLYFAADAAQFEFSSEIKNLEYQPDLSRLREYLCFGRFGEDFLPFANVREVAPGSFVDLDCRTGKWAQTTYRDLEKLPDPTTYAELAHAGDLVDRLDELLQRSIRLHEQSDAPIGYLCSGGLDSSLITAMAARRGQNLALYHADFEGADRNCITRSRSLTMLGPRLEPALLPRTRSGESFPS